MDEWRFVSDSSYDLDPADWDYEVKLGLAPLVVTIDGKDYVDLPGVDVDDMVTRMTTSKTSSSACPSVESFAEQFRMARNLICLAMTAKLSGTYNAACQARNIVLEEDPTRKIHVIDTKTVAGGHILLARALRDLHKKGLSFEEIVTEIEKIRDDTHILFSLASFHNFIQNGRVSPAAGAIAKALKIRPVAANSPEGELIILEKPRGFETALDYLTDRAGKLKDLTGVGIIINYVNTLEDAQYLKDLMLKKYPQIGYIELVKMRCLCSYYADRGGLLMSF